LGEVRALYYRVMVEFHRNLLWHSGRPPYQPTDYRLCLPRTNKPIARLTLHVLALTRLTGLRLFDIKCVWFNEDQYCESAAPI